MNHTTNRTPLADLARHWIEEGWQRGNSQAIVALHSPDFIDRDSADRSSDNAGFAHGIDRLHAAFPDFHAIVEDLVVDDDAGTVAIRWSAIGTHAAPYLGLPASGRRIRFKGIEIIRCVDGRIVERWGEWDGLDLLSQMQI